jgi:hypothetical protein
VPISFGLPLVVVGIARSRAVTTGTIVFWITGVIWGWRCLLFATGKRLQPVHCPQREAAPRRPSATESCCHFFFDFFGLHFWDGWR